MEFTVKRVLDGNDLRSIRIGLLVIEHNILVGHRDHIIVKHPGINGIRVLAQFLISVQLMSS